MKLPRFLENKFLRDTATLQVGSLLTAIGNFASAAALAFLLGPREQGRYYLAIALYTLLWCMMNQGFVGATVSQVAAANARGLPIKVAAWLAYLAKAYLVLGVVLVVLGYFLLPPLAVRVFNTSPDAARWAIWLTLTPFLEMPKIVLCAGLQGTRRMLALTQIENTQEISRVFLVVAGVLVLGGGEGAILGMLASSALASIVGIEIYLISRRENPGTLPPMREILSRIREVPLRTGLALGTKLGLFRSVDAVLREVLPSLLLKRFGTEEWVAYLRIAQRILGAPLMFMVGFSRTALPTLSELAGLKDFDQFRRTFWKACLYSGAFISTGLLLAMLFVRPVLRLTFPESYLEPVWVMCLILLPGYLAVSFSIASDTFYLVSNTLKAGVIICVVGFVVCAAAQTWLAGHIRTTGPAWGLMITMCLTSVHFVYAAWWFRHQRRGVGGPTVPTAAELS
ncbi:MAG TPA: oligosaccharide flippase family protein [Planctomycetota bacterium]|nr:oligosaccharide flippase family protein [Planctomycetota bacterium]